MKSCIPDIVICERAELSSDDEKTHVDRVVSVYDVKHKSYDKESSEDPKREEVKRADSHQLFMYAFLLGADKCGFIMPIKKGTVSSEIGNLNVKVQNSSDRVVIYCEYDGVAHWDLKREKEHHITIEP